VTWGHLAVVAERDVLFGMSRVFEALTESHFASARVFRRRDEAEAWLGERPVDSG
jgi:hypothetical protein